MRAFREERTRLSALVALAGGTPTAELPAEVFAASDAVKDVTVALAQRAEQMLDRIVAGTGIARPAISAPAPTPPPERHIDASQPGEIVGVDCFYVGRLAGTKALWQYSAIDIASSYAWAELHTSERNPIARHTKA